MTRLVTIAPSAATLVMAINLATVPTPAAAQQLETGRTLYQTDCAICHLPSGQGGVRFGDAVSANLTARGLEETYHHDDALIERAILQAKDEDGAPLDMPMPAWQGRLTPAQAARIVAYLKTLQAPGE